MTVNKAVAMRVSKLLYEKKMTQYRLAIKSGVQQGSLGCIMHERNKTVTLSTVAMLARGFDMTLQEFLDDELFSFDNMEID